MAQLNYGRYFERKSFAEHGDDILVQVFLERLYGIYRPVKYLDIGCWHPIICNNTYMFYIHGGTGILIDPNSTFKAIAENMRPNDVFYNIGIKFDEKNEAKYYDFGDNSQRNTFLKETKEWIETNLKSRNIQLKSEKTMQLQDINPIIKKHFQSEECDFLSIDCEGADSGILRNIDLDYFKPKIICIEHRDNTLDHYLEKYGFEIISGTPGNTVYANIHLVTTLGVLRPFMYIDKSKGKTSLKCSVSLADTSPNVVTKDNNEVILKQMVDEKWYLSQYPDVAASGMNAADHYFRYGHKEGRKPCQTFTGSCIANADAAFSSKKTPQTQSFCGTLSTSHCANSIGEKLLFISTRFSLIADPKYFEPTLVSKYSFEQYKNLILDRTRLLTRLNIFSKYQLPFIDAAKNRYMIYHLVGASCYLPDDIKYALHELEQKYNFLHVKYYDENVDFGVESGKFLTSFAANYADLTVASARLDDDDILHTAYFESMSEYINKRYHGMAISFPEGYFGFYKNGGYIIFSHVNTPKNSFGLSYICHYHNGRLTTKYNAPVGSHGLIDRIAPTIIDSRKSCYIYTMHNKNLSVNTCRDWDETQTLNRNIFHIERFEKVNRYFNGIFTKNVPTNEQLRILRTHNKTYLSLVNDHLVQTDKLGETIFAKCESNMLTFISGRKYLHYHGNLKFSWQDDYFGYAIIACGDNDDSFFIMLGDGQYLSSDPCSQNIVSAPRMQNWEKFIMI